MKADLKSTITEQAGAVLGGGFSSLWLPEIYYITYGTFLGASALSKYFTNAGKICNIKMLTHFRGHPGGPHQNPHLQIFRYLKGVKGSNTEPWRIFLW